MGQIHTILSLLAYAPSKLATMFDFELEQKKKCGSYASKLLVQTAHTLAKSCKNEFLQAYAAHAVANC